MPLPTISAVIAPRPPLTATRRVEEMLRRPKRSLAEARGDLIAALCVDIVTPNEPAQFAGAASTAGFVLELAETLDAAELAFARFRAALVWAAYDAASRASVSAGTIASPALDALEAIATVSVDELTPALVAASDALSEPANDA